MPVKKFNKHLKDKNLEKNNGAPAYNKEALDNACSQLAVVNNELKIKKRKLLELEQQEGYYKGAFHHAAIGMALVGPDGSWKEVNDSLCKIVGYTREELMKITFQDITHPDDLLPDLGYLNELVQGKRQSYQMEKRYFHKNGWVIWVLLVVSMVKDREGKLLYFISQIEDITERKKIEATVISSEEKYRSLFYSSPLPKWIYNIETFRILDVNEQAVNHYGYSRTEFLSMTVKDIGVHCEIHGMNYSTNTGVINCGIEKHQKKNGLIMLVEVSVYPIRFDSLNCMIAVCNDVTEKKLAEEDFARFFKLSPDLMAIAGTDGYFKKINPSFSRTLGYSAEEFFEKPISHFIHPEDRDVTDVKRKSLVTGVALLNFENRYLTKNGETRWLSWTSTPLAEEGIIFAVAKDTTEKKKVDEEKKRILESISDFFFALDKEFNFTYINSATEKLFQMAPGAFIGKNIWEKLPWLKQSVFFENIQKSVNSKERVSFEFYDETTNNWFEESFYPSDDGLSVFFRYINNRKAAEKALKESFEEKNTILESIGDGFFTVDKNWTVTYWNKMSEQLLKIKREDIIGKNLWDMFADYLPSTSYGHYHYAVENNAAVHFEDFYPPLNSWLEVSAYPSHGGLSVYFKDITIRKKAEDAIRTSNERYDIVAKATNDAIWDWDLVTNNVVRPGNRLETLYGYVGCDPCDVDSFWNEHAHPEDWEKVNNKRNALFEDPSQNFWEDEYRFLTAAGEYAYVHDKGYIIRNQEGIAIRMIGASQDITREKEQVNEITRIQQNLDSLINTTTDLIWSINKNFKILAANKAFFEMLQAFTGKLVKEGDDALFNSAKIENRNKWERYYTRALSGETFQVEESFYKPATKEMLHTMVSFTPIITKGNISGVACFSKNVTELKKAGQKLLEMNDSLEKRAEELAHSNSELERFAYVASHDLQEPLRMISSFLQLLEKKYDDRLDETARKYIHFSVDGANRMKQLINDLLHYSRIGMASIELEPVNMNLLLADVLMVFKNEIHTIDAEIIIHDLPCINAEKSAMFQLVQNLVGNALKYRSNKRPVIIISGKEENNEWIITIEDNGIGIDRKFRDKIFIIFQRLHNKDEFGGTGIGLAICKKIIERYKGKIWVESEFGKGSKFIFAIPTMQN